MFISLKFIVGMTSILAVVVRAELDSSTLSRIRMEARKLPENQQCASFMSNILKESSADQVARRPTLDQDLNPITEENLLKLVDTSEQLESEFTSPAGRSLVAYLNDCLRGPLKAKIVELNNQNEAIDLDNNELKDRMNQRTKGEELKNIVESLDERTAILQGELAECRSELENGPSQDGGFLGGAAALGSTAFEAYDLFSELQGEGE